MKSIRLHIIISIIASFCIPMMVGCKGRDSHNHNHGNDLDTLKVVTLYGPTSYFEYRGEKMGIDYENIRRFATDNGMELEIQTVNNIPELVETLKKGDAHLAAYPIPAIAEYKEDVIYCGPEEISRQVLVQRKGNEMISDVTQLVGKEVVVEKNSKYLYRLENLNEELGGGINIQTLDNDTIASEDLLEMVARGQLDFTVIDSQLANLYQSAFPNIDTSLNLSSDQIAFWAAAPGLDSLAVKIDRWENLTHTSDFVKSIYKRYYDRSLAPDTSSPLSYFEKLGLDKGKPVSAYDNLFKKHSSSAGYDWRLLAAISFCESRFIPCVESRFGAYGLMQVIPSTAKAVGINPSALGNPDVNILAASRILRKLDEALADKVEDPEERMKFVVAAYNAGLGHIYDSIALARKTGLDPQKWNANVGMAALMKSRPEYYNDPEVKHGYFRGRETVEFVDRVSEIYHYLLNNTKS